LGAAGAAMVVPADAADRTITNQVTTPVRTSEASDGPGNITITSAGSVSISSAGAAATVDSNHNLTNEGGITSSAASNAIGVRLVRGVSGSYVQTGSVNVTGSGSDNIGILLDGTGTGDFTGALTLTSPGTLTALGTNSAGIVLNGPLVGNLTSGIGISALGSNASGMIVRAPVTGAISHLGTILAAGTTSYSNVDADPLAGWGVAIGASISGGFLNEGPATSTDTVNSAAISVVGSMPALYISPLIAGATAPSIVIGPSSNPGHPGFSVVNRGNIVADGNDPGVNATTIRIEGADGGRTTTLSGGLYNRGIVRGTATSSNLTANSEPAAAANAFAFSLGSGASMPTLRNDGTFLAQTSGTRGGTAVGIQIDAGASLPSLVTTGFITATSATGESSLTNVAAYGIRDLSGTLRSIVNTGTITATTSTTDKGSIAFAADLSLATSAVSFTNSGTVSGGINFGGGANTFTIDGETALASGRFRPTGTGTLDVNLARGTLRSDQTVARTLTVGSGGKVEFALSRSTTAAPLVTASGTASFADGAEVLLTPTSFLPSSGTYTLLTAAGGLTFADFPEAVSGEVLPFLFEGGFTHDSNNLFLTLEQKTAEELELTGNAALVYEPATEAAALDDAFGAALLRLENQEEVEAAFATLVPPTTDGVRALAIAATDQATGPIGARQRAMITTPKQGLGFWTQQFYSDLNGGTTSRGPSYFASGMGLVLGAEWGDMSTLRMGTSYTYYAGQATERHPRSSKANVGVHMFSLYGGWRWQDFFVTPQVNAGYGSFTGRRFVQVAGFERNVTGDWSSLMLSGGVMVGYVFDLGLVQVIPQVGFDGLYMHLAEYTESGGGAGVDLNVGAQEAKSARLFAGVVTQSGFTWEGGRVQPQILAGFSQELMNEPHIIDARFEALPGSPFAVIGPTRDPSKVIGGASLAYIFENWTAGVNYDASHQSGAFQQAATVNITSRF
jgi:uncharacterized protein with beta-barrel porin domain